MYDKKILKDNLPKRMRYYQGMIDLNILEKGENYKNLKKSFVIFICTFDLFGLGRMYTHLKIVVLKIWNYRLVMILQR